MNQPSGELEPADLTSEKSTSTKIRRCAFYARVSSSSRDDSPLSSIEAQIKSCKAYVHSQKGMGWDLIEPVYADDGYSGGTMERPAIRQLFQDMEDGKIDAVVIQRLDRICRNVLDICDSDANVCNGEGRSQNCKTVIAAFQAQGGAAWIPAMCLKLPLDQRKCEIQ